MFRNIVSVFVKVMLALGAVYLLLAVVRRLTDDHSDYIEIYNDQDDFEGDFYS